MLKGRDSKRRPGYPRYIQVGEQVLVSRKALRQSKQRARRAAWLVVACVVTVLLVAATAFTGLKDQGRAFVKNLTSSKQTKLITAPPAGEGSQGKRVLPAITPTATSTSFSFLATQKDGKTPVRWDPCRVIHYVVYGDSPVGGDALLIEALDTISKASGLQFIKDGQTTEKPTSQREAFQPSHYGQKWAPMLVAWSSPEEAADLAGDTVGFGGPLYVETKEGWRITVSGELTLDSKQVGEVINNGHSDLAKAVILHELGHVIGLNHVNDDRQIMYPETQVKVRELGDGDLVGLAKLGAGDCQAGV